MFERELIFVSGKGGVGKSAVAAALALRATRRGKRVLAIGLTESLGLATHLGVDELGYNPVEVRPGLYAMAVDRAAALDEYLRLQLHAPRLAPTGPFSAAVAAIVDAIPGVREVVTVGKPVYETWGRKWDIVIVDASPLGQLFSYLGAPATISDLVPTGRIREQAARMAELLADGERAGLVLVTTAGELPVTETAEAIRQLHKEQSIELVTLVVNRLLDGFEYVEPTAIPDGPYRDAAVLHAGLFASQERWLAELPEARWELPYLFGVYTPAEVTVHLAELWDEADPRDEVSER